MIECIAKKDIKTADELCDAVQDCKKELRGVQIGKHHKIGGAGGKTILLVNRTEKEFVAYEDVLEKKGHFGKLIYKVFFEEEDEEEVEISTEEAFLQLKEQLTESQLVELSDMLSSEAKCRLDLTALFGRANDFTEEIKEAEEKYKFIGNKDVIRAFGLLKALNVQFNPSQDEWDTKRIGYFGRMKQNNITVEFLPSREVTDDIKIGFMKIKDLSGWILCRNDYGDALFRRDNEKIGLIVVIDDPRF